MVTFFRLVYNHAVFFFISLDVHDYCTFLPVLCVKWHAKLQMGYMECKATNVIKMPKAHTVRVRAIYTVTQQKAFIFGACVHRMVVCDSIRMDPEFKPRDGARGQNLGHFCKVLLCCG